MKSAHEICGCLDGVRCALTADRDRLMGMVNSAENRARLAEDRERVAKVAGKEMFALLCSRGPECEHSDHMRWLAALDAQEPRT